MYREKEASVWEKTVAFAMTNSSKSFSKSAVLLCVNTIRSIFLLPMKDKINIGRAGYSANLDKNTVSVVCVCRGRGL